MIINTAQTQMSKIFQQQKMGIEIDGMAHQMMIDGIYSNKLNSVFREISTNARDSHIESKNPNPFEININVSPDGQAHIISIKDFGTGLSEEDTLKYLCNLNSSSKRDSNDVVGCFGIGSKSVFSLTNKYHYECIKDGILTKLALSKDKNGTPTFTHSTSSTNSPNSVTCIFAIREDLENILNAIYIELALFDIKPVITIIRSNLQDNIEQNLTDISSGSIRYTPDFFFPTITEHRNFYIIEQSNNLAFLLDYFSQKHLACGIIGYKLDNFSTESPSYYQTISKPKISGLLLKFDLGEIKFGVSREMIENTNLTQSLIAQKFINLYKEVPHSEIIAKGSIIGRGSNHYSRFNYQNTYLDINSLRSELFSDIEFPIDEMPSQNLSKFKDSFYHRHILNSFDSLNKFESEIVRYFVNGTPSLSKIFNNLPTELFKKSAQDNDVNVSYIYSCFANDNINSFPAALFYYKYEYFLNLEPRRFYLNLIIDELFVKGFRIKHFKAIEEVDGESIFLYSAKALGSDTFLSNLTLKEVGILKIPKDTPTSILDKAVSLTEKLFDVKFYSMDEYRQIDLEFTKTLRKATKKRVVQSNNQNVTTSVVQDGRTELGLKQRCKFETFILYKKDSNSNWVKKEFSGDDALTSTQLVSKIKSIHNDHLNFYIIDKDIVEDEAIINEFTENYCSILFIQDQSDMEELKLILSLAVDRLPVFIDKQLTDEVYDNLPIEIKNEIPAVAFKSYTDTLCESIEKFYPKTDFLRIFKICTLNSHLINKNRLLAKLYFKGQHAHVVDRLLEVRDKLKIDIFNISKLDKILIRYIELLTTGDLDSNIPLLYKELYGDDQQ